MGKMLIIAEKPDIARKLADALGGFSKTGASTVFESAVAIIAAARGHVVELSVPEAADTGRTLETLPIIPRYFALQPIDDKKAVFSELSKLMKRADVDSLVNACDAGREGEAIFRLIVEAAGCRKPTKRMWMQSMNPEGMREAFRKMRPGSEFDALGDAARCRAEADWLVGINGSRALTRLRERQTRRAESMNMGRVQSPTLAITVAREEEIAHFVPKDYWEVHGTFRTKAGAYLGKWVEVVTSADAGAEPGQEDDDGEVAGARIFDRARAETLVAKCRGGTVESVRDEAKRTRSLPPSLYDLTLLQREANRRFRLSVKKVLDIAQALYEKHEVLTYPRTDSCVLPEDYVETARETLCALAKTEYGGLARSAVDLVKPDKRLFNDAKVSDHFAIVPTGKTPQGLTPDEARIYDMVARRFIAAFYPAAEFDVTVRTTVVAGERFLTRGRVMVSAGWREVYGTAAGDAGKTLVRLEAGERSSIERIEAKGLKTTPPRRYTEDTLLGAMEGAGKLVDDDALREAMKENGLGRPSTRAAIIEGLLATKDGSGRKKESYLLREGKEEFLVPTPKAQELMQLLRRSGEPDLAACASPALTGEWEAKLLRMERGTYARAQFMSEVEGATRRMIAAVCKVAASTPGAADRILSTPCPKCGGTVGINLRTFACRGDGCGFTIWRETCGRDLTDAEVETLIRDREIAQLDGFVGRSKRSFSAGVRLTDEGKVELVFEDEGRPRREPGPVVDGVPCPKCRGTLRKVGGEHPGFVCDQRDFRLFAVIAGRTLSEREARELVAKGAIGPLDGFTSTRTNKPFSAGLRLSRDKTKVEFVFEKG